MGGGRDISHSLPFTYLALGCERDQVWHTASRAFCSNYSLCGHAWMHVVSSDGDMSATPNKMFYWQCARSLPSLSPIVEEVKDCLCSMVSMHLCR